MSVKSGQPKCGVGLGPLHVAVSYLCMVRVVCTNVVDGHLIESLYNQLEAIWPKTDIIFCIVVLR